MQKVTTVNTCRLPNKPNGDQMIFFLHVPVLHFLREATGGQLTHLSQAHWSPAAAEDISGDIKCSDIS